MSSFHIEGLPKLLGIALTELSESQQLIQWNINSHGSVVSVSMKFAMPGHVVQSPMSNTVNKHKSPAQVTRDSNRSVTYNEETPVSTSGFYRSFTGSNMQHNLNAHAPNYSPVVVPGSSGQGIDMDIGNTNVKSASDYYSTNMKRPEIDSSNPDMSAQSSETNQNKNTCNDFQKVVVDTRHFLKHAVVRGLTKDKNIVCYEVNKGDDCLQVMDENTNGEQYLEMLQLINRFNDQLACWSMWDCEIECMYECWEKYKDK